MISGVQKRNLCEFPENVRNVYQFFSFFANIPKFCKNELDKEIESIFWKRIKFTENIYKHFFL
jgi:hypothetical protein